MHVLFGGTKLLQSSGDKSAKIKTPDGGCLAVVLRTGFGTAQGAPCWGLCGVYCVCVPPCNACQAQLRFASHAPRFPALIPPRATACPAPQAA